MRGYCAEYADGRAADPPPTAAGAVYRAFLALDTAKREAAVLLAEIAPGAPPRARMLVHNVCDPLMAEDWRVLGMAVLADMAGPTRPPRMPRPRGLLGR